MKKNLLINDVILSNSAFAGGSPNGTVIGQLTVDTSFGNFRGSLTITGADAANFQIIGSNLETKGVVPNGTYSINIVADDITASNSPFVSPETLIAGGGVSITGITLSNSNFTGGSISGTVVGAISVQTTGGGFAGSLSLSGPNAASFQIVGSNLETNGVIAGGTYSVNIVATQSGVAGSPFTQSETITGTTVTTITGVTLSNSSFAGGTASGTMVGNITVQTSGGAFTGALSLSGADAASFQIVGSTLQTNGVVNNGSYSINIMATQVGAVGSPFTQAETITGNVTITGVTLSSATFVGGSTSGTTVGTITVQTSGGGSFAGTLSLSGINASSFQIVGSTLETNGVVTGGSYSINIIATQSGAIGSPFTQAKTITGIITITGVTLSNSSFTGGVSGVTVGNITVQASGGSFTGGLSLSGTNASNFQIVGSTLKTNGVVNAGSYSVNIVAAQAGATGSPFTQAESITGTIAITGITLSNSSFVGGVSGATVGNITAQATGGSFTGIFSLSGTNASNFQIVGSTLKTNGVLNAGSYSVNIVATQAGAVGSPFTQAETITGNVTITGITLSNSSFAGGSVTGTVIGVISVQVLGGVFAGSLTLSGTNASSFQIVGSNLVTNGVLNGGSYAVNIVATQAGAISSPFTQAETIAGTITITGVTLSNSSFTSGLSGATVGTITVQASGGSFAGSLSLSGTDAASFQIAGSSLITNGSVNAGSYSINIVATQAGATGSPFTQPETITGASGITITGVTLSNSSFAGGVSSATVGNITVQASGGSFTGGLSLSGTNAASFQIVGSTLKTNGVVNAGSYSINIVATQAGAVGSPFTQAKTITGNITITSVTLSNSSFAAGSASGTTVGNVTVAATGGTFIGNLSLSGTDAASFQIVGSTLKTNGVLSGGSYSINIIATQAGAIGSPFTQAKTITGAITITGITLSNSNFAGGVSGAIVGTITVQASGGSFAGTLSLSGTNAANFQIVGSTLKTNGVVNAGTYAINIIATQAGATGSPFTQAKTITGSISITGITLSNSSFAGGSVSGTTVGNISVLTMGGTFAGGLSLSGTNATSFQIVGTTLKTNGVAAAGSYSINIIATQTGDIGSPFTQAETIQGTASSSLITTFAVGNYSGSSISTPNVGFFHPLAPTDLPSGSHLVVYMNDGVTPVTTQQDREPLWADNSARGAVVSFVSPDTIVAGGNITYQLKSVTGAPNRTANVTLAQITANTNFLLQLTNGSLGADVFQLSVNDIIANGAVWPAGGSNPTRFWRVIRSGPICTEWRFTGALRRVSDGAIHKWLWGDIWLLARSPTGPFEIAGFISQPNVRGATVGSTVGVSPEPKHTFYGTLLNGATSIYHWGGPNDWRVFTEPATNINISTDRMTIAATNPIIANHYSAGVPIKIASSGTLPSPLLANTVYWLGADGFSNTTFFAVNRANCNIDFATVPINLTTQGTGTLTITPLVETFPYTGVYLMGTDGRRIAVNGNLSPTLVQKNWQYLTGESKAVPPYLAGVTVTPITSSVAAQYSPDSQMWFWDMNEVSDPPNDERIGYINRTGLRALYQPLSQYEDQHSRVFALCQGQFHIYLQDETVGEMAIFGSVSYTNLGTPQPDRPYNNGGSAPAGWMTPSTAVIDYDGTSDNPYIDPSHMPAAWVQPYLASGDDIFLNIGINLSNMSAASNSFSVTYGSTTYSQVQAVFNQTRGMGWGLRMKGQAAHFCPASSAISQYLRDQTNNEFKYLAAWVANTATTNEKTLGYYNESLIGDFYEPWMGCIFYMALGMERWRGEDATSMTALSTFLTHFNKFVIGQIDSAQGGCLFTAGERNIFPYSGNVVDDSNLQTTWAAVFTNTAPNVVGGTFPNPWVSCPGSGICTDPEATTIDGSNSLVNFLTCALSLASINGVSNAATLYNQLRAIQFANSPPLSFSEEPVWAIGLGSQVSVPIDGSYALVFDEEFNGSTVDTTKWTNVNNNTFGSPTTALSANNVVSGGFLHQNITNPSSGVYTGACLVAKTGFLKGYFETRMKVSGPSGNVSGLDESFWMNNNGVDPEIDVLEFFGGSNLGVNAAYNASGNPPNDVAVVTHFNDASANGLFGDLGAAFHVYGLLWTASQYTWYIDGIQTLQANNGQVYNVGGTNFTLTTNTTTPLFMLLWALVGAGGGGTPNGNTTFPTTFMVDYVHVYQQGGTPVTPQSGYGGPGDSIGSGG